MKLFLVRNTETQWNTEQRLHGNQDSPLTPLGHKQAGQLAKLLSSESIDKAYASDLGRAIDTAKVIVAVHKDVSLETRRELRERSHGIAQGLTQREVFEQHPKLQEERLANKYTFRNPKGESYFDAEARLRLFVEELKQKHFSHSVLIVSHAAINRILIGLLLNKTPDEIMAIDQPHDCVYVIEEADTVPSVRWISPDGSGEGFRTRAHLQKPSFEDSEDDIELEEDWA